MLFLLSTAVTFPPSHTYPRDSSECMQKQIRGTRLRNDGQLRRAWSGGPGQEMERAASWLRPEPLPLERAPSRLHEAREDKQGNGACGLRDPVPVRKVSPNSCHLPEPSTLLTPACARSVTSLALAISFTRVGRTRYHLPHDAIHTSTRRIRRSQTFVLGTLIRQASGWASNKQEVRTTAARPCGSTS